MSADTTAFVAGTATAALASVAMAIGSRRASPPNVVGVGSAIVASSSGALAGVTTWVALAALLTRYDGRAASVGWVLVALVSIAVAIVFSTASLVVLGNVRMAPAAVGLALLSCGSAATLVMLAAIILGVDPGVPAPLAAAPLWLAAGIGVAAALLGDALIRVPTAKVRAGSNTGVAPADRALDPRHSRSRAVLRSPSHTHVLDPRTTHVIGRGSRWAFDVDLRLDDPKVSRRHAEITCDQDGRWVIHDCGSANGTFVNGKRLADGESCELRTDDRVVVGSTEMLFALRRADGA